MGAAGEVPVTRELHLSPSDLTELIVSLGGVKFWVVSVVPLYIGWVLAQESNLRHLFIDDLRVVLGIIVVGPLLGTFTLLLNVYYDMVTTDRVNPRKKYVQVVEELIGQGLMERDTLLLAAFGFAATGLVVAGYVSGSLIRYNPADRGGGFTAIVGPYGFFLLTVLIIALSIAYSVPKIHWKGVAGLDLFTNMVGFGVLCPLAGWSLLRPIESAPWWYIGTIALFLGALYAPTTASDYEADRTFGIRTMAVRLGVRRTLLLGFGLEIVSVITLVLGWSQRWFPFDGSAYEAMVDLWPFVALQILFYGVFVRRPTVGRMWALLLFLSILQGLGVLLMLWRFVNQRAWSP
ncbi:MAG TPA: UbiA family prenyltransferase [Thermoplasmata archaeon]|nr:UbiA family prenyltransferase [Thermoplasmata archaeon]